MRVTKLALLPIVGFGLCTTMTYAQTPPVAVSIDPARVTVLDSAGCIQIIGQPASGKGKVVKDSDGRAILIFEPATDQKDSQRILADLGIKEQIGGACETPARKQYDLRLAQQIPTVSGEALSASFKVLMAAFVLAVLLESAFALLFNWRVYKIYLSGQAWRSVIMFAGAMLVVQAFKFDLIASLLDAYYSGDVRRDGVWGTSVLTAMILAGGSSSINSLFLALGLRSPQDQEAKVPKSDTEAWISVRVTGSKQAEVHVTQVTPTNPTAVPTTVGVTGARKPRLKEVLFGAKQRVPEFSGYRVSTNAYYAISVKDLVTDKYYDVSGQVIASSDLAAPHRFAARAVIDFTVNVA